MEELLQGTYKGIKFNFTPHHSSDEKKGILITILPNGIESTHIVKDWDIVRIFQFIESMRHLI